MADANKFKNSTDINVTIDNPGRDVVTLKPGEIVRYGNSPTTKYVFNGQSFDLKADQNYVIGIAPGSETHPKLVINDFSKAGVGGFDDSQTTYSR
ncbi:hypothetical protein SPB21_35360 [Leptothoe sp. ISB3NOV94-8A]